MSSSFSNILMIFPLVSGYIVKVEQSRAGADGDEGN
jgi:hypothetical protein